jgi:glycosyltransferase involved in cell wall biosynthesis
MNILFLYISLPHLTESGVFIDLIKEFANQGHNVKVVTPLQNKGVERVSKEAGIDVLRFKTDQLTNNKSNIKKGLAYIKLIYQYPKAIKRHFGKEKFDLIIAHSLPPEIGIIANILKRRYNAKFYLMLCEYIWHDSVSLGFFKESSLVCKYYKWLEKTTIRAANYIGSPSQGNIDFTLKYYPWAKNKNIHLLHYTQTPIELTKSNENIKIKLGIEGKFVAIYGGNMSIAQKIENVIEVAEACKQYEDIVFLLLGRGQELLRIQQNVKQRGLTNIIFLDFLPKNDYLQLLSVCDIGIVSLNEKLAIPNIPSKTLSYFNLSVPIVASIDRNTDYGQYLKEAKAGLWSYAGDTENFKKNIIKLYQDPSLRKEMGQSGNNFYMKNMLPTIGYQTIIKQLKQ